MQVIYSCLVIMMFVIGTGFGYCIGKNGAVVIDRADTRKKEEITAKKSVEQQWEDMMNYDGNVRKDT